MPTSPGNLITPQPDSLVAEAFEASRGAGSHGSLEAFTAYCMTNGETGRMPRCLHDTTLRGPELLALSSVRRIVGVGPKTELTEDYDAFYGIVERIENGLTEGRQPAPFIAEMRDDGWYYLLDGNHTKMALKRFGVPRWWAIIVSSAVSHEPVTQIA